MVGKFESVEELARGDILEISEASDFVTDKGEG